MNAKYFVPYETAKALKEKGYPQITDYVFFLEEIVLNCTDDERCMEVSGMIAAPTYHEVVDWLEGKNKLLNIEILCGNNPITKQRYYYGKISVCEEAEQNGMRVSNKSKSTVYRCENTREEALNAAILKALELI